jgi:hypothetical protein
MGKHKKIVVMAAVSTAVVVLIFRIRKVRNTLLGIA